MKKDYQIPGQLHILDLVLNKDYSSLPTLHNAAKFKTQTTQLQILVIYYQHCLKEKQINLSTMSILAMKSL